MAQTREERLERKAEAERARRARKGHEINAERREVAQMVRVAEEPARIARKFRGLTEELEAIAAVKHATLSALTPEKLERAAPSQLGILYGIMVDKERLLRGEATTIVSYQNRGTSEELAQKVLKELEDRGVVPKAPVEIEATEADYEEVEE